MRTLLLVLCLSCLFPPAFFSATPAETAARGLLERILPKYGEAFVFETIQQDNGRDVFEIEDRDGRVVLRGNNGVSMASALNHYLNRFCNASLSLQGHQLDLPKPLPAVEEKIRVVTPFRYRYCFNYCCFSYSMAWWDWEQWERTIDWMALHGVNMPLAVTGQESTWRNLYREMGLTDEEIAEFIVGPAYLPFGWMGCIDGWGGPLPDSWIDSHEALQKKIVARERELGMTPVLQGFTGHVPRGLQRVYPEAEFEALPEWAEFPHNWFVNPRDPLFARIGRMFIEEQTRQFGTDHLYGSDTFIEMPPPDDSPAFLDAMAKAVHGGMTAADPDAIWVMQGWLFVHASWFWKPPQAEALLTAIPDDRMIVLDLFCENHSTWDKTNSFYGKPWLWCIIQSFGDQVSLHGALPGIYDGLNGALVSPERGSISGAGMIMEGLGYNPVVHDLMSDLFWQPDLGGIDAWIRAYPARRYGTEHPDAIKAWKTLAQTAYTKPGQIGSLVAKRPRLGLGGRFSHYSPERLLEACESLLKCADVFRAVDAYQYDAVHVTRQVLLNKLQGLKSVIDAAYFARNEKLFEEKVAEFRELIVDIDTLLGTREEFLLGRWLDDAKSWGETKEERLLYEWNARNQITLWGDKNSPLHDYAAKQWAGMLEGFYLKRWDLLFDAMRESLKTDAPLLMPDFRRWEEAWTRKTESYSSTPEGDPVETAKRLLTKHKETLFPDLTHAREAVSLTTDKPVTCSFELPDYPASLANDSTFSDTNQYWATDVGQDPDAWWQVDLEEETMVGRVVVVPYYGDERTYGFRVEVSIDHGTWDAVGNYTEDYQPARQQGTTIVFDKRPVRYIRVTFTYSSADTGRHLVEVMAYEE